MIKSFSVEKLIIRQNIINKFTSDLDEAKRAYNEECQNLFGNQEDWLDTPEQFIYSYSGVFYLVNLDMENGHHTVKKIEQLR